MMGGMGSVEPWRHHYYLCTMSTPSLRSLGLGVARHVAGPINGLGIQA
jgi:hypothetical protein